MAHANFGNNGSRAQCRTKAIRHTCSVTLGGAQCAHQKRAKVRFCSEKYFDKKNVFVWIETLDKKKFKRTLEL